MSKIILHSSLKCGQKVMYRHLSVNSKPMIPNDILQQRKYKFIEKMKELSSKQKRMNVDATLAGVLVPFCLVNNRPSVLLTKRSSNIIRNKSDVCFPGGKLDKEIDRNIIDTALRETAEEIGLPKSLVDVWLETRPIIGNNDASIYIVPIFGFIHTLDISKLVVNQSEVSSVFTVTLEELCDPENRAYTKFNTGYVMPLFFKYPYKIWGFTAIVLDFCLANLLPDFYSLKFTQSRRHLT